MLTACILTVALALAPVAVWQAGSGGPLGLAVAAGICLFSGWASEALACLLVRQSPLVAMVIGMAARMALPLAVCLALAALGQSGRQHLAFIGYLLAFYIATLALETWLAVKRLAGAPSAPNRRPR